MELGELSFGEPLRRDLGEDRNPLGGLGELAPQHRLGEPRAPQDGAGARGAALLGEHRRKAEDPPAPPGLHAVESLRVPRRRPFRRSQSGAVKRR